MYCLVTLISLLNFLSNHYNASPFTKAIIPPMCGVNILMNMVREIVAPTFLYQSTVKSEKRPANTGKKEGSFTSEILALTSRMIRPFIIVSNKLAYSINELNQKHLHYTCCFLFSFVKEPLERGETDQDTDDNTIKN